MNTFLTLLSGVAWTLVYFELIRSGFKHKTYGMPIFALALNLSWEIIYSYAYLADASSTFQGVVNLVWALFDIVIVFTYFKYGKKYFPDNTKKYFLPFSILAFISGFAFQFAFFLQLDSFKTAAGYSAFAQNAIMSVLFVYMLFIRKNTKGQSMTIAISKWIGTLAPTLLFGLLQGVNIYILFMGGLCFVFDIIYIFLLYQRKYEEKLTATKYM